MSDKIAKNLKEFLSHRYKGDTMSENEVEFEVKDKASLVVSSVGDGLWHIDDVVKYIVRALPPYKKVD